MILGKIPFDYTNAIKHPKFLFSGSFNPFHLGHRAIIDYIYNKFHHPVDLEISVHNTEKDSITCEEIIRRANQIAGSIMVGSVNNLYITDNARFLEKAYCFLTQSSLSTLTFVCGYDTICALASGRYYCDDWVSEVVEKFDKIGVKWLVFPRKTSFGDGVDDRDYAGFPEKLMCNVTIAKDFFLNDIASRNLRS